MQIIKRTESLCPVCLKKINAKVVKEGKNVYMRKECNIHGPFKFLVEKDVRIYKKLMNKDYSKFSFTQLIIPVTSKCNLQCPICYFFPSKTKDLSLKEIKKFTSNKDVITVFSGGEPTVREDLFQTIDVVKQKNSLVLATNGLRFSSYDYTLKIKKSGLKYIMFSFNGFDDRIYKKINGRALLKTKLKALENLKKVGIKIILSTLLVRDLNEDQVKSIFDFCLKNRSYIREMRIRSMVPKGKYIEKEKFRLSELLTFVCSAIGINKKDVFDELQFWELVKKFLTKKEFIHRPCSIMFHLDINNEKIIPIAKKINLNKILHSRFKKLILLYYLIKIFGIEMFFRLIKNKFDFLGTLYEMDKFFLVNLRAWPGRHDVDLKEISYCRTGYLIQDKIFPFCYYNIINK